VVLRAGEEGRQFPTGDEWVETDTTQNLEVHFAEVRRTADETLLYDKDRDLYLNVPTQGGTVRWAHSDPMVWTDLYVAQPAEKAED
jgi:hypothetical protein